MSAPQIIILAILAATFVLFAWGRWRYDVVAMLALLAAVSFNLIPADRAFAGFGHPATITVAAVLILSRALAVSGATDFIAAQLTHAAHRVSLHIAALSTIGAGLSMFMNNVGTLGLLMPAALESAAKEKRSPSLLLMPLSFGTILGGLVTLIGTPPNIIISAYRADAVGTPFRMFDFSAVGAVTAVAGLLFVALVGWRLIPKRALAMPGEVFDIENYVAELRVPKDGVAVGKTVAEVQDASDTDAYIVTLIRRGERMNPAPRRRTLRAEDALLVEGSPDEIEALASKFGLEVAGAREDEKSLLAAEDVVTTEAVVQPRARIEGRTVESLRLGRRWGINLLAVSRQGRPHRGRLRSFRFKAGDVLLLPGDAERLPEVVADLGCLPLAERGLRFGAGGNAGLAVAIFGSAIALAAFGILPLTIAFGLAVVAMVVLNILPVRELYAGIDWPVIVLLGAMIPVGGALQSTGTTDLITGSIMSATAGLSPIFILGLLLVVTMTLSDILNNAATAVIMAPIGIAIAERLGASPDPFLMAVAVGASCAFLTPIGHQNNTLIMGPGGYRFGDYWRMGLPLEAIIVAVSLPMIVWVWPL